MAGTSCELCGDKIVDREYAAAGDILKFSSRRVIKGTGLWLLSIKWGTNERKNDTTLHYRHIHSGNL
jgi:hypothetical protein